MLYTNTMSNFRVRFIPLGGIVGVTKNMYVYELYKGDKLQDIIIIDCGIGFPREQEFGVDHEIPDITYLRDKTKFIRAVLFSHGHEDHISALRFHYEDLGKPPVYASKLTAVFVKNKFDEFRIPVRINDVDFTKTYTLGSFEAKFIRMTHSIPDTTHILLKSPVGAFYHGSDYKIDLTTPFGPSPDLYEIAKAGKDGVLCLFSDCLGSDREGFTLSEKVVGKTFEDEIRTTKGKFIMTTFASNISRVRQCAEAGMKFNRKICLLGRSMRENSRSARKIGYFPIPEKFMVDERQVNKFRPNQICIIATGSQGQFGSALSRLATDQHKYIRIEKDDKVVFSSDPIPGNEEEVYDIIERLYVLGADVRYSDIHEQLHASGHGSQEDMKILIRLLNARYVIPIGGTIRHQRLYSQLAQTMGYKDDQIYLLNEGDTVWFEQGKAKRGEQINTKNIYVDAYGVGDIGDTILRDRMTLSKEGIVLVILKVDSHNRIVGLPEFISRGFIYSKGKQEIFNQAAQEIQNMYKDVKKIPLRRDIISRLEKYFVKKTNKEPLVSLQIVRV